MHQAAELRQEVRGLMSEAFMLSEDEIPDDASQETLSCWSSLSHMILLSALEEHYRLRLSMKEMTSMTSLPKILTVLEQYGVAVGA